MDSSSISWDDEPKGAGGVQDTPPAAPGTPADITWDAPAAPKAAANTPTPQAADTPGITWDEAPYPEHHVPAPIVESGDDYVARQLGTPKAPQPGPTAANLKLQQSADLYDGYKAQPGGDKVAYEQAKKSGRVTADYERELHPDYNPVTFYKDIALSMNSGLANVGTSVGQGIKAGGSLAGADSIKKAGEFVREVSQNAEEYWNDKLTPYAKNVNKGEILSGDMGANDVLFKVILQSAQSSPGMVAMAGVGMPAKAGLSLLAPRMEAIAGRFLTDKAAASTVEYINNGVAFGGAEGLFSGLQNAAQSGQQVMQLPIETLRTSPSFQTELAKQDQSLPVAKQEALARESIAEKVENQVIVRTTLSTGTIGAVTGGGVFNVIFGKQAAAGLFGRVLEGVKMEGLQELLQSGPEQLIQNLAMRNYADPKADVWAGVAEQAVQGGLAGALLGGVGAGVGGSSKSHRISSIIDAAYQEASQAKSLPEAAAIMGKARVLAYDIEPTLAQELAGKKLGTIQPAAAPQPGQPPAPAAPAASAPTVDPLTLNPVAPPAGPEPAPAPSAPQPAVATPTEAPAAAGTPSGRADTASSIVLDHANPVESIAAMAKAPITPVGETHTAPEGVAPGDHAAAAGDLAEKIGAIRHLELQLKITPPAERPALQEQIDALRAQARADRDAYAQQHGEPAAGDMHYLAASTALDVRPNFAAPKAAPVQEPVASTNSGQTPARASSLPSAEVGTLDVRNKTMLEQRGLLKELNDAGVNATKSYGRDGHIEFATAEDKAKADAYLADKQAIGEKTAAALGGHGRGTQAEAPASAYHKLGALAPGEPDIINNRTEITRDQAIEGNYPHEHGTIGGLGTATENKDGSVRVDKHNPTPQWASKMVGVDYVRIKGTEAADFHPRTGERQQLDGMIDSRLTPEERAKYNGPVWVVDQVKPDGSFDEHKILFGNWSREEATAAYLAQYPTGWKGLGGITPTTMDKLKSWATSGNPSKPFAPLKAASDAARHGPVSATRNAPKAPEPYQLGTKRTALSLPLAGLAPTMQKIVLKGPGQLMAAVASGGKLEGTARPPTPQERSTLAAIIADGDSNGVLTTVLSISNDGIHINEGNKNNGQIVVPPDGSFASIGLHAAVVADAANGGPWASGAVNTLVHEAIGHRTDLYIKDGKRAWSSASSPRFEIATDESGLRHPKGDIMRELANLAPESEAYAYLKYPLSDWGNKDVTSETLQKESHAQLAGMYHSPAGREVMAEQLPTAHAAYKEIYESIAAAKDIPDTKSREAAIIRAVQVALRVPGADVPGRLQPEGSANSAGAENGRRAGRLEDHGQSAESAGAAGIPRAAADVLASRSSGIDMREGKKLAGLPKSPSVNDIAERLNAAAAKSKGKARSYDNPKDVEAATRQRYAEIKYQLGQPKSGLGWYVGDVNKAWRWAAQEHPDLGSDPVKRQLSSIVTAVMSPGTMARLNFRDGLINWDHYEKTGDFSIVRPDSGRPWGVSKAREMAIAHINAMLADPARGGERGMVDWLLSEHTKNVLDAEKARYGVYARSEKEGVEGLQGETKILGGASSLHYGVEMFGPKVGPFATSMNGMDTGVAVDVWETRAIRRLFGTFPEPTPPGAAELRANPGAKASISESPTPQERQIALKMLMGAARDPELVALGIKNGPDAQGVGWFFEQQLYRTLAPGTESGFFSDGAKEYVESRGGKVSDEGAGAAETPHREVPKRASEAEANAEVQHPEREAEAGQHVVNIGLNARDGKSITVADANKALKDAGVKVIKQDVVTSNSEPTLVASLDRPLTDKEAHQLAVDTEQLVIPQRTNGVGTMHGPGKDSAEAKREGWDKYNADYFLNHPAPALDAFAQRATDTPAFKKWFGESRVTNEDGEPAVLYHGTVSDFSKFDRKEADPSSYFGRGIYLTNTPEDASRNYATAGGADNVNKLELLVEQKLEELAERSGKDMPLYNSLKYKSMYRQAHDSALAGFAEHEGAVMPLYAKMKNPFIIGGKLTGEQRPTYISERVIRRVVKALNSFGLDRVAESVVAKEYEGRSANDLMQEIRNHPDLTDEEVGVSDVLAASGFDGIIDHDATGRFKMAGMGKGTTHYIAFKASQLKSASGNSGAFNPRSLDITAQRAPFSSGLERAITTKAPFSKRDEVPAEQLRAWLAGRVKDGVVKGDELAWTGLDDYLKLQDGKVTRDEVQKFLDQNGVKVEETMLGGGQRGLAEGVLEYNDMTQAQWDRLPASERAQLKDEFEIETDTSATSDGTKYADRVLPGGKNYRELLLTLPKNDDINPTPGYRVFDKNGSEQVDTLNKAVADRELAANTGGRMETYSRPVKDMTANFQSSHFDQPNILAHVRFNERTDANGKKVLFLEELQSDFGQKTRKEMDAVSKAVDGDFQGIVDRMKKAGVLSVDCS